MPDIYQARDLHFSFEFLKGHYVWFGPDLTGGGKTPGPTYYWLLALPLYFFKNWISTIYLCYTLASCGAVISWYCLNRYVSPIAGIFGYFIFLNSAFIQVEIASLWNPSYIFIFEALIICLLWDLKNRKSISLFLTGIVIGLATQIHLTQLVFLIAGVLALSQEAELQINERMKRLSGLLSGWLLTLVPFLAFYSTNREDTFFSSQAGLKTFFNPYQRLIDGDFAILQKYFSNFISLTKQLVALDTLIVSAIAISVIYSRFPLKLNRFFTYSFFLSLFVIVPLLNDPTMTRYLVTLEILCVMSCAVSIAEIFDKRKWILIPLAAPLLLAILVSLLKIERPTFAYSGLTLFLLVVMLISSAGLFWFHKRQNQNSKLVLFFIGITFAQMTFASLNPDYGISQPQNRVHKDEIEEVLSEIIHQTNWNYDEFRQKTFLIGFEHEDDLSVVYEVQYDKSTPNLRIKKWDGAVILRSNQDWNENFVLQEILPHNFFATENSYETSCASAERSSYVICYYKVLDRTEEVNKNNIGYAYRFRQPSLGVNHEKRDVVQLDENSVLMTLNECPNFENACNIYFRLNFKESFKISIEILGDPLSVPYPTANPAWTARLVRPTITIGCEKSSTILLSESLGFVKSRETLLAPFKATVDTLCRKPETILLQGQLFRVNGDLSEDNLGPFMLSWERP